ncbi:MAG: hypothetical protein QXO71_09760 [Candidatus Jordarchaeaceae archaeon]
MVSTRTLMTSPCARLSVVRLSPSLRIFPQSRKAPEAKASLIQGGLIVVKGCSTAHPLFWELKRLGMSMGMVNPLKG